MRNIFSGYVGKWLCNESGVFNPTPSIVIDFPMFLERTIPGLTITWSTAYGEWATEFRIKAYHGENVVFSMLAVNNKPITIVKGDIQGYTKITIEVLKWSKPYRRARMEGIILGVQKLYDKTNIMSYRAVMSVDPLSAELPKSEITFEIKNLNGEYNPYNSNGEEKYIMERQRVSVSYGYKLKDDIEWIPGGIFYLSEWETPQNGIKATFKARDILEFMTDIYTGPVSGNVYGIAEAALLQADLPSLSNERPRWVLHSSLKTIFVPEDAELRDCSIAEVLQYVANAGCCVLYQDRYGQFHIEPLLLELTDYSIDRFNSYANSEMVLSKPLKAVEINQTQYTLPVARSGTTQPVANPLVSDEHAQAVAEWVAGFLTNRHTLSGSFRADPRLDPLDIVTNVNQFSTSYIVVSEVKFSYNGAFRGDYRGRSVDQFFAAFEGIVSGEAASGEV